MVSCCQARCVHRSWCLHQQSTSCHSAWQHLSAASRRPGTPAAPRDFFPYTWKDLSTCPFPCRAGCGGTDPAIPGDAAARTQLVLGLQVCRAPCPAAGARGQSTSEPAAPTRPRRCTLPSLELSVGAQPAHRGQRGQE